MQIEVVNHESVETKFISTKWYHGWCDDRFDHLSYDSNDTILWSPKSKIEDFFASHNK